MFWKMEEFRKVGKLSEQLHYCMDLEFWHRYLLRKGVSSLHLFDKNLAVMRYHSKSKSVAESEGFREDRYNLKYSIIKSLNLPACIQTHFERIDIGHYYHKRWDTTKVSPKKYAAYAFHDMAQQLFKRMNYFFFLKTYFLSFWLMPFKRRRAFYFLPLRRIKWWLYGYR